MNEPTNLGEASGIETHRSPAYVTPQKQRSRPPSRPASALSGSLEKELHISRVERALTRQISTNNVCTKYTRPYPPTLGFKSALKMRTPKLERTPELMVDVTATTTPAGDHHHQHQVVAPRTEGAQPVSNCPVGEVCAPFQRPMPIVSRKKGK